MRVGYYRRHYEGSHFRGGGWLPLLRIVFSDRFFRGCDPVDDVDFFTYRSMERITRWGAINPAASFRGYLDRWRPANDERWAGCLSGVVPGERSTDRIGRDARLVAVRKSFPFDVERCFSGCAASLPFALRPQCV